MRVAAVALFFLILIFPVQAALARGGPPRRAKPVKAAALERRSVQAGRSFVGTIEPSRRSQVSVETAGLVVTRPATLGQRIEAKSTIATLRADVISKLILIAEARVTKATRALEVLQNGAREEDKRAAAARVVRSKATLDTARWKLSRVKRLYDDGRKVPEDEVRSASLAVTVAERDLEAANAELDKLRAGARADEIAQAQAEVAVQQAEVGRLKLVEKQHTAKAPFSGYVVAERTEVGQWVRAGDPVVELVDLDHVDVVIPVLEDFIGGVVVGATQTVTIPALGDTPFDGKIVGIVPQAATGTRTIPVRIRVKNKITDRGPILKAGMFARVSLPVGKPTKALMAPKDALKLGGRQPEVFVVDPESKRALPVPVTLGVTDGAWIEVRGAVQEGQQVVTKGNERLIPGDVVQVEAK